MPPQTTEHSRYRAGLTHALAAWERAPRIVRNGVISLPTFLIDLGLLFLLARRAHLNYLVATVVSFLVANALGYFLARRLVFAGTSRGVKAGLVYFLVIAALSAFALTPLMWLSVSVFHVDIILSRIITASIVGVGGYLLNLVFNFRVAHTLGAPQPESDIPAS
jgi:putative flippase GtrA